MPTTKAIQSLDDRLSQVPPGTLRHEALEAARRFKSSWLDLGRVLWTVWKDKAFKGWGYAEFDTYCAKELRIKAVTAKKLLYSYSFLEQEEPTVLQRMPAAHPATVPSYDAVNVLRLLKRRRDLPEPRYQTFRAQVLDQARDATDVRRQAREMLADADADPEAVRAARRQATIRRMIGTLKALQGELRAGRMVPHKLLTDIETLTRRLDTSLEERSPRRGG